MVYHGISLELLVKRNMQDATAAAIESRRDTANDNMVAATVHLGRIKFSVTVYNLP